MVQFLIALGSALIISIAVFFATRQHKGATFASFLLVFIIGIGASLVAIVPANHVGIVYSEFGGTKDYTYQEGIHFKAPWESVYKISTEVTGVTFEGITVQTKDSQFVDTKLQVQLAVDANNAIAYFKKHRTKGLEDIQSILEATITRELETESTRINVMELLGDKRSELVIAVNKRLKEEFMLDGIRLDRVVLVDTDAGTAIEESIAREASAKKDAETALHLQAKAEAEGEARKVAAKAEAEAKILEAQGEAEALRLVAEALAKNPALIEMKWIEKWNGEVPRVSTGDSGMILDLSSLE